MKSTPSASHVPENVTAVPTSYDGIVYDHDFLVASCVIMALLTVSVTVGNSFVMTVLIVVKKLRTASHQLTINLCFCGTVMGLVVMPYGTMTTYLRFPVWGEAVCQAMALIGLTATFAITATLTAIGVDRYLKVKHIKHRRPYLKNTWSAIIILWLISFLSALPPLLGWGLYRWVEENPTCTNDWLASTSYTVFVMIFFLIIPLAILIFCYGSIIRIVVRSRRRLDNHQRKEAATTQDEHTMPANESTENKPEGSVTKPDPNRWADTSSKSPPFYKADPGLRPGHNSVKPLESVSPPAAVQKLAVEPRQAPRTIGKADIAVIRAMVIVVSTYVVFWYPYIICVLMKIIKQERMSFFVETVTMQLAWLGMSLNPIIYVVSDRGFRSAFQRTVRRK